MGGQASLGTPMTAYVYDLEVFPNFFGIGFLSLEGEVKQFSTRRGNIDDLPTWWAERSGCTVFGFNSSQYDDQLLHLILAGERDPAVIYARSSKLIAERDRFLRSPLPAVVDLRNLLGGKASKAGGLKELGIKMDFARLQELPLPPDKPISEAEQDQIEAYNVNDLAVTLTLVEAMTDQLEARHALKDKYGVAVLGRSDASLAEDVLRRRMFGDTAPPWPTEHVWHASGASIIHPAISFTDPALQAALDTMRGWELRMTDVVTPSRHPDDRPTRTNEPDKPAALEVRYGEVTYTLGTGGLHSRDVPAVHRADEEWELLDVDVESYYPALIIGMRLCPAHLDRSALLAALSSIVEERIRAKRAGERALNMGLKIAVNSIFGKFNSPYSWLCDPRVIWQVTVNGQLILLVLVELLSGISDGSCEVLSANTDCLLLRCRRDARLEVMGVVAAVEEAFNLHFSLAQYQVVAIRDINNAIAIDIAGNIKGRGAYAHEKENLKKKATERIVIDAVQAYFLHGVPVADTIRACTDVREFLDYFVCSQGYSIVVGERVIGKGSVKNLGQPACPWRGDRRV